MAKICGIYTITNLTNGKMYVGFANNIMSRKNYHFSWLRRNVHANIHLQRAWNEYGGENFLFEVLEECEERFLRSQENWWCNMLNVHNDKYGYNIQPTSPEGITSHSQESKEKMSKAQIGKKRSIESIERGKLTTLNNPRVYTKEYLEKVKDIQRKGGGVPIVLLSLDGVFYKEWRCIIEAAEEIGATSRALANACRKNKGRLINFYTSFNYIPIKKNEYNPCINYKRINSKY